MNGDINRNYEARILTDYPKLVNAAANLWRHFKCGTPLLFFYISKGATNVALHLNIIKVPV